VSTTDGFLKFEGYRGSLNRKLEGMEVLIILTLKAWGVSDLGLQTSMKPVRDI